MTSRLSSTLISLASTCLRVPAAEISPQVPLARYGLDSLAAIELTTALERTLRRRLPESLLLQCPDLASLERYLTGPGHRPRSPVSALDQMRDDSRLPACIRPATAGSNAEPPCAVLLTGATGFLGGYLLRALLRRTSAKVYCLCRPGDGLGAVERLRRNMQGYGSWDPGVESRVEAVEGDVGRPRLGLDEGRYAELSRQIEAIYHAAAGLSWTSPYGALRNVNARGTRELIALACAGRPKPFHFVSSASVCYSTVGPRRVSETDDLGPYLRGLHLGYAQSKWVAEQLVRQAGERGLPTTIFRPSLITGDRDSGISNTSDLLSRLLKGVILMGAAPDLDWSVDGCPVDYVADAIVTLAQGCRQPGVFHLTNPAARHWRECVLWMNLFGYRVQLLPFREWLARLAQEAVAPQHPLRELLPFFSREPRGEGGLTLPELYEDSRRSAVCGQRTLACLQTQALGSSRLDSRLLESYFHAYIDQGYLPPARPGRRRCQAAQWRLDAGCLTALLRQGCGDESLEVREAVAVGEGSEHSILAELTSWQHGSAAGLKRYRLTVAGGDRPSETIAVVVKRKAWDEHVIDVAQQVAGQCSPALGRAFARFGRDTGLAGCHLREIGVYRQVDERFRRHAPALFGALADETLASWTLVLEDISGLELLNSADDSSGWRLDCVEAAIRGLAALHSIWYGREDELRSRPWLGPVTPAARRGEMAPLWKALGDHAAARFEASLGHRESDLQDRLAAHVAPRWQVLDALPRSLIHNDFNPRNLALRRGAEGLRLCVYDWELATLGVPQHDLAELLCFVLTPDLDEAEVRHYLDLHRSELAAASRSVIDPAAWELGFRLSLHDLLTDRLAMYALIDRFRPQRFLSRIVSTWRALYELFPLEESDTP